MYTLKTIKYIKRGKRTKKLGNQRRKYLLPLELNPCISHRYLIQLVVDNFIFKYSSKGGQGYRVKTNFKNHCIEMGVFTKNQFFNLISTTIKVPLRISNLKNTHFAMIAFLLLLTFILPFIKGQQDLDLTYEVAENLASLPLECHSKLYPFKFNNLWNNASEAK